jgi:hypothetical protein
MVTGRELLSDVSRLLAAVLGWVIAIPLLVLTVLRFVAEDRLWPVGMWVNFAPYCFVIILPLIVLALVGRAWRLLILLGVLVILGGVWFAPMIFVRPGSAPASEGVTSLRVITYTPFRFRGEYAGFYQWATENRADIIAVQDFRLMNGRGLLDQVSEYPYISWKLPTWRPSSGNLVLSRYPILEQGVILNGDPVLTSFISRVVLDVNGQAVAFYNVDLTPSYNQSRPRFRLNGLNFELNLFLLGYDAAARNYGVARLLEALSAEPLPYIVAGNFGFTPMHRAYERLSAVMTDSRRETGPFMSTTWPIGEVTGMLPAAITPMVQFDYVWHSRGAWQTAASLRGPVQGSDHLPLVTDLRLLPG